MCAPDPAAHMTRIPDERVVHSADILGQNTTKAYVLEHEQVQLVGVEVSNISAPCPCRLQDVDGARMLTRLTHLLDLTRCLKQQ